MSYCVYRFKDIHEQIIYVGKTKSFKSRMNQHFSKFGHLSEEAYDKVSKVEYIELNSKIEMDIKELYYIDKWKPIFNTANKNESESSGIALIEETEWLVYIDNTKNNIELNTKINTLIKDNDSLSKEKVVLEECVKNLEEKLSKAKFEINHYSKKLSELQSANKEKVDTNAVIASVKSAEEFKDYFNFEEALLLVEFVPNYEFMVTFNSRIEKKYHIFNNGEGYSILEVHSGIEHKSRNKIDILFTESILREMDKTVLVSGQSDTQVWQDIKYATKTKEDIKKMCDKHKDFLDRCKIAYKIRDDFEWYFYQKFGEYLPYHWNETLGQYSTLYKAGLYIEEHEIKTHKQMLELMKNDIESVSEAS